MSYNQEPEFSRAFSSSHITAKVICDSVNVANNSRLTTFQITLPRIILAELNTHKSLSKNCESSRAVPIKKLRAKAIDDPFYPVYWGKNQSGMSAREELTGWRKSLAKSIWWLASREQILNNWMLEKVGVHKQTANRLIEPWLSVTDVITGTDTFLENFFQLRLADGAQPEMQVLAWQMKKAYDASTPRMLSVKEPHLPYILPEEWEKFPIDALIKISVARCCRTSYNNMMGKVSQPGEDIKLFYRALESKHFSPMEHQGFVPNSNRISKEQHFNLQRGFRGWYQLRAFVEPVDNTSLLNKYYDINL